MTVSLQYCHAQGLSTSSSWFSWLHQCSLFLPVKQVVAWLSCKIGKLQQALKESASGQAFQGMDAVQLAAYCIALLSEYLQEHWLEQLRDMYSVATQGIHLACS